MFGPNLTSGDLLAMLIGLLLIGAVLGIGCNAGCSYLREHINVEWK